MSQKRKTLPIRFAELEEKLRFLMDVVLVDVKKGEEGEKVTLSANQLYSAIQKAK